MIRFLLIVILLSFVCLINSLQISNSHVRFYRNSNVRSVRSSSSLYSTLLASKWIDEIGKKDINVNVVSNNEGNYVSKAITSLKKGDIVFSMPMGLCLDASKAAAKFSSVITPSKLRTGDIGMLALLLIYEKSLGLDIR